MLFILVNLMIIDELKQLTKVAEHEQYKTGALKKQRQVKQSGNIFKITLLSFEIYICIICIKV